VADAVSLGLFNATTVVLGAAGSVGLSGKTRSVVLLDAAESPGETSGRSRF